MKRFLATAAAATALFAASSAHALFLSVDDFNTPALSMWDQNVTVGTVNMAGFINGAGPGPIGGGTFYLDGIRRITHNWILDGGGNGINGNGLFGSGSKSSVSMGNDASPTGALSMKNADNSDSVVDLRWNLAAGFVPLSSPVSFFFQVVGSDNVNKYLSYSIDNGANFNSIGTFNTSVTFPTQVAFTIPLTAVQQAALNTGVPDFILRITGDVGWDFSIDSFGFQIPEPTSLALVGLALLGAGVATRRRKV